MAPLLKPSHPHSKPGRRRSLATVALLALLLLGACGYAGAHWAEIGALGADWLRSFLGVQTVSRMEVILFKVEDDIRLAEYSLGLSSPAAPWTPPPLVAGASGPTPTAGAANETTVAPSLSPTPPLLSTSTPSPTQEPTAAPPYWPLPSRPPLGHLAGEGEWSPYLLGASGTVYADRTYFQPDPMRPYVVVGVVAFDLGTTRLHYVVGTQEPESNVPLKRLGEIAPSDKVPGVLLAAFNGGFKGRHGNFGVMVDGTTLLPPRDGMGTVVLNADGQVRIDQWGRFPLSPDIAAWRQNGPLIVNWGEVNPEVDLVSFDVWGTLLTGKTLTWRSGLGLSRDGHVLYYAAGPSLSLRGLASTLSAAGAYNALELDINNYWVEFVSIRAVGPRFFAYALFPEMSDGEGRYLGSSTRDFFYITTDKG